MSREIKEVLEERFQMIEDRREEKIKKEQKDNRGAMIKEVKDIMEKYFDRVDTYISGTYVNQWKLSIGKGSF